MRELTVQSISPFRRASSSSLTKTPVPPMSARWVFMSLSPVEVMPFISQASPVVFSRSALNSSACAIASWLSLLPAIISSPV